MKAAAGNPLRPQVLNGCRIGDDGLAAIIPTAARALIVSQDHLIVQEILTVCQLGKLSDHWDTPDLSSIIEPSSCDIERGSYQSLLAHAIDATKELGIVIPDKSIAFNEYHLTTKNGPNGIAMLSAQKEFTLLPSDLRKAITQQGGPNLRMKFYELDAYLEDESFDILLKDQDLYKDRGSIRRLSVVRSDEGKNRVIAIFDYWSQCALKPLHGYVLSNLDGWFKGTDVSTNQRRFDPVSYTGPAWSYDLSSATDRLPVSLTHGILKSLIGDQKANAWQHIMTSLPFDVSFENIQGAAKASYACGQGMGAYSSWSVGLALTHHLIVRVAGYYVYKHYNFANYLLQGDDIAIFDGAVARVYERQMTLTLGVKISPEKSLVSENSFEFAKRFFIGGVECSHLKLSQLCTDFNPLTNLAGVQTDISMTAVDRSSFTIDRSFVKRFLRAVSDNSRSTFSTVDSLILQSIIIGNSLGNSCENIVRPKWLIDLQGCFDKESMVLDDLVSWWAIRRLESLRLRAPALFTSFINEIRDQGLPSVVNQYMFPHIFTAYEASERQASFSAETVLLWDRNQLIAYQLSAEDYMAAGTLKVQRRLERVREMVSHASRRVTTYLRSRDQLIKQWSDERLSK